MLGAALAGALTACSGGDAPAPLVEAARKPAFGAFGLDPTARDPRVAPGDDFYRFANGGWLDGHQIPADRSRWGAFDVLAAQAEVQVRTIVEALPADAAAGTPARQVRDFYAAYLDTDAIEAAGLAPAHPLLDALQAARTHAELAALLGRPELREVTPLGVDVYPDPKAPDRYLARLCQAGINLPNRDFYLRDEPEFAEIRAAYREHVARMLALAGATDPGAQAGAVLDVETRIARAQWPAADARDRDRTYNLLARDELAALAPGFPWDAYLASAGLGDRRELWVGERSAVAAIAALFAELPVEAWRSYATYSYLRQRADVLPRAFDDESFRFYGQLLAGQERQRERWKRAVERLDDSLGEAVGRFYVERHFPAESKAQMLALVENLRAAFGERLAKLAWMTPATRLAALGKLAAFAPRIGYPERWRDYGALLVRADDAFGNVERADAFEWQRRLARIDAPTDRDEWAMPPQTVNAYYDPTFNQIVFPAAILQPPFFDPDADAAVNYGGIGAVIGHEMGHGFDDQGSKSDAQGVLRSWWTPADRAAFTARVEPLVAQYDRYEPLPGLRVNGRLTLGENIGDVGGLTLAHAAYQLSRGGRPAPSLDGLSGEQRLFLAWAQVWRARIRDGALRNQVLSDPHSPTQLRVDGVVRNLDAWYEAFDVGPDAELYLPPAERVRIW